MSNQETVTQTEALIKLYYCLNGPSTAGRKWVTYTRSQAEAMLDVLKQILIQRGCALHPNGVDERRGNK